MEERGRVRGREDRTGQRKVRYWEEHGEKVEEE